MARTMDRAGSSEPQKIESEDYSNLLNSIDGDKLTAWETSFFNSVVKSCETWPWFRLSEKQLFILNRLPRKYE